MTAEAKVLKVEDRANLLAKNFWNKVICNNDRETERKMNRLDILMCRNRFILPKGSIFMMWDTWRESKKYRDVLERKDKSSIFQKNYQINSSSYNIDLEIGKERAGDRKMKDSELVQQFCDKYELSEFCNIIYTDRSKQKENRSVGVGIVIELQEAQSISIDKRCSIYTAELLAIEKALGYIEDKGCKEDVLILTDSQSACKDLLNCNEDRKALDKRDKKKNVQNRESVIGNGRQIWIGELKL